MVAHHNEAHIGAKFDCQNSTPPISDELVFKYFLAREGAGKDKNAPPCERGGFRYNVISSLSIVFISIAGFLKPICAHERAGYR